MTRRLDAYRLISLERICTCLLLLFAIGTAFPAQAQEADTVKTREVGVSADLLEEAVVGGEQVRRLIGNVRLRQDETTLRSERALQYLNRREILFIGDVLIVERGDTLRADSVLYNRTTKVGRATGHVELSDGDVLVTAPSGLYFTEEKRAQFTDGVRLVDSSAVLTSAGGEYWSDDKRAEFYGNVELDEDRTHLESDTITYLRETDVSIARSNVFIERAGDSSDADSLTRMLLYGNEAYNEDSTAYSRIEGRPLLVQLRQDSVGAEIDTLVIRASILESIRDDSLQRLIATDSVRIWQRDLAAVADSVVYDRIEAEEELPGENVRLFGAPIAWLQDNQLSGDTILVNTREDAVDSLFVRHNAFVARLDTALQRIHHMKGEYLTAAFEGDSLKTLSMGLQAEAINFRAGDGGEPSGAVRTSADRITFYFKGDEVERLSAIRAPEGTYYPEAHLPQDFRLDGFVWVPERMPTKLGLLGPVTLPQVQPEVATTPLFESISPSSGATSRK